MTELATDMAIGFSLVAEYLATDPATKIAIYIFLAGKIGGENWQGWVQNEKSVAINDGNSVADGDRKLILSPPCPKKSFLVIPLPFRR